MSIAFLSPFSTFQYESYFSKTEFFYRNVYENVFDHETSNETLKNFLVPNSLSHELFGIPFIFDYICL